MRKTKMALLQSIVALILCVSMLVGSTMAWFTDSVTSGVNHILSGNLDVELVDAAGNSLEGQSLTFRDVNGNTAILWEPGCTFKTQGFRVANKGSLALEFTMYINGLLGDSKLLDVIDFRIEDAEGREVAIDDFVGHLSGNKSSGLYYLVGHMAESADNDYQGLTLQGVGITVCATQATEESDSFGPDYDEGATFPTLKLPGSITAAVKSENGLVSVALTMADAADTLNARIPAGVKLGNGVTELTLSVTEMTASGANIQLQDNEILRSMDVHIAGVAADNTKPMQITIREAMMVGLNIGNYTLYHVEDGVANAMTSVTALADLDAHNEFYYDPATGDVTLSLATFSEVAFLAEESTWEGNFDYSWYTNAVAPVDGEAVTEYIIANADQLAAFGAIVGGMDGQTRDSFSGKTVKLIADINLGDKDNANESLIFHPVGYYNDTGSYKKVSGGSVTSSVYSFEGTFDGNGNTISNFYQNTWEMFGDYNSGYSGTPNHYKDAMGLFGYVVNGKICNLTVNNFSSDGEFTPTGVIAAYACNATFENIAITNCNPRVYNTGNGGIVGIGGNSNDPDTYKLTFNNITIDNTNIITALWGSWDVACGGLIGMFRGAGHVYMTNCHVGAQIDVYNDVCGNYQYYWYRYSGMMIGTNKNMTTDANGYTVPETNKFHAVNCTVHFGDWNDYYYCELVANSLASYTHDHQFSRLTLIKSLDEIKSGDTWRKTGNFLLISGDTKTCYHIVKNSDGTLKQHLHTDAGEETVGGETVLKEDKQIVYLPFNQLFTGYGWGVKHVPIYDDGTPNPFAGVTILGRETANSVEKFKGKVTELSNNKVYKLGDIFNFVDNGVELIPGALMVSVHNLDETNPVSATFKRDTENWENGMLTLTGTGTVTITIQDYYFCTPTTIEVTVTDRQPEVKFETKFTGDFLYRVGNQNAVKLDSLFKAKADANIGTVSVTVETLNGTAASGTYTSNANDWTKGSIQFSGTGVVKVTITDNDYCTPTELYLEVVDAVNATSATSATTNNVVLLQDVSGSFTVYNGNTVYGNGFTVTLPTTYQASYTAGYVGYITMNNGNLDNIRIEGPVYPVMNIYQSQSQNSTTSKEEYFYNSILINGGNCTISNSYISGSRTAICVRGGNNIVIENTTLSGGAVANMEIAGVNTITLRNLTTGQTDEVDSYGQNKTSHGMGVYVSTGIGTIYVEGELTQRNWVNETQWNNLVGSYASFFPKFFTDSAYADYQKDIDGVTYVNLAMVFACNWNAENLDTTQQTNGGDYAVKDDIELQGYTGGIYSVTGVQPTADDLQKVEHQSSGFSPIAPKFEFDNSANHDEDDANDAADTYCEYSNDTGILSIGISGSTKTIDLSGISIKRNGVALAYTAYLNGNQISGNSVTIKSADGTKQTLVFKVVSTEAGYDAAGNPIVGEITYLYTVTVELATLSYPAPVWNVDGYTNGTTTYQVGTTNCYYVYYKTSQGYGEAVPIYDGIKINYYDKTGNLIHADLSSTQYEPKGTGETIGLNTEFTYSLTDGSVLTMTITGSYKSGVSALYFTTYNEKTYVYPAALDSDSSVRPSKTGYDFNVSIKYTFTDPNGLSTETITINWYGAKANGSSIKDVQWQTFDKDNGKKASICVTPDTLVTLADGTQKEIQDIRVGDMVLAWNFYTGAYEVVPVSLLQAHSTGVQNVLHLYFEDGTELKILGEHGVFDADLDTFVFIDEDDVGNYIGHNFVKQDGDGFTTVKLVDYKVTTEHTTAYTILSYGHYNVMAEGMFTVTPAHVGDNFFNPFDIGEDMKYDDAAVQADIEKYGLYTYEDFDHVLTYEQFVALNIAHFKVSVGKGYITYDGLIYLIENFVNNEDFNI